jgi:hypothetical protein
MAELQDLINQLKESSGEQKSQLHEVERHTRNSRRHLLEMKKEIFRLSENIAIMSAIEPPELPEPETEGEKTEQRREDRKFEEKQLAVLTKIADGITGLSKGGGSGSGGGGFLKGLKGLGLGGALAGAGIGLGAAGAGIGAFFMGLAGAEAIMAKFGSGDNLKKLLINLGEGLDSLSDRSLTALAVALGAGAAIGAIPGLSGAGAGMGIAWIGVGIGAFFAGLALADKGMSYLKTDMGALKRAAKGLNDTIGVLDEKSFKVVATLIGVGAAGGALFGPTKMAGVAAGIGLVGLGIGSFFAGLSVADAAANWMSVDGSKLATQAKYLAEGITALAADPKVFNTIGGLIGGGAAAAALFGPSTVAKGAVGMTAIGMGIGGFFAGLALGDKAASWLGVDGSTMKKQMQNLAEGLGSFSNGSLIGLGALLGAGALFGAVGGPMVAGMAAVGMTMIGAGLAGFLMAFDGLSAIGGFIGLDGSNGKILLKNIAEGLVPISKLDGANLKNAVAAIALAGPAMVSFLGSEGLAKLGTAISEGFKKAWRWITGADEPDPSKKVSRFQAIVDELEPLKNLDPNILSSFGKVLGDLEKLSNLGNFANGGRDIKQFANNLKSAMPEIETALYGSEATGINGYRGYKIRGLANGGDELAMAVDNLNQLNMASQTIPDPSVIVNNIDQSSGTQNKILPTSGHNARSQNGAPSGFGNSWMDESSAQ